VDQGRLGVQLVVKGEELLPKELVVARRDANDLGGEAGRPGQRDERPGDIAAEAEAPLEDVADLAVVPDPLFLPLRAGQVLLVAQVPEALDIRVDPLMLQRLRRVPMIPWTVAVSLPGLPMNLSTPFANPRFPASRSLGCS
jgi:hypothetical protein